MDFITTKEAAERWGISQRRVAVLCEQGRIIGGTMGHRTSTISQDDLKTIAHLIIDEDLTLREIAEQLEPLFESEGKSISKSSISEALNRLDNKELLLRAKLQLAKHTLKKSDLERDMKPENGWYR
jgi:DNA-binding transcriptional MerR regulator